MQPSADAVSWGDGKSHTKRSYHAPRRVILPGRGSDRGKTLQLLRRIMNRNFNLVRQFAVLSLICITLTTAVSAYLLSQFLTEKILLRDATVSMEFVQSIVEAEGTWSYFARQKTDKLSPELESFFNHVSHMPDVVRANVYSADRSVLWSSNSDLIGKRFQDNEELEETLSGKLTYESGIVGDADKLEHANLQPGLRFIETYVPIWNSDHSTTVGAVELYKLPSALHQAIVEGERLVWGSAALGGVLLFAILFWIVRRASLIMEVQQQRLVDSEALTMIGETASAVAHSMRNPLATIRASAELSLSDDLEGARESAQDIINETDRLDRWARDLLQFSQLDASNLENVDVNSLIDTVLAELGTMFQRQGIEMQLDLADALPSVRANAAPIGQVLRSLVVNAIEAATDVGRITVATALDKVQCNVVVTISDNGPGLSKEMAEKIFRPFFTTKLTGTGLGLPLSRRLVERYGGTLSLSSTEGQGVTVTVHLPIAE